jgi:hypothetical protein
MQRSEAQAKAFAIPLSANIFALITTLPFQPSQVQFFPAA